MDWSRPIHPAHALAFVGICACGGFVIGLGIAAFIAAITARKAVDALLTVTGGA